MKAVGRVGQKIGQIVDNGRTAIKGLASLARRGIRGANGRVDQMAESAADGAGSAAKNAGGRARGSGSVADGLANGIPSKSITKEGGDGGGLARGGGSLTEAANSPGGTKIAKEAGESGDAAKRLENPEMGKPPGGDAARDGVNASGDAAEGGAQGARGARDAADAADRPLIVVLESTANKAAKKNH